MNRVVALAILLMGSTAKSAVVNLNYGLVGKYEFSGNASDSSGNLFDGTVFSASLAPDRFGNADSAYYFNGSDSYISLGNLSALNFGAGDFSISTWVKLNGSQNDKYFVSKYSGAGPGYGVGLGWGSTPYGFIGTDSGSQREIRANVDINDGAWHHIVLTYTQGVATHITLDNSGIFVMGANLAGSKNNSSPVLFGKYDGAVSANYYDGYIDEVAIYNRALNQDEIAALYLVPEPSSLSLLLVGGVVALARRRNF